MLTYAIAGRSHAIGEFDFTDKIGGTKLYIAQMLARLQSMFEYQGLPDTIPQKYLEQQIMLNGVTAIAKADDGQLYALEGNWGGPCDAYYIPQKWIVANPWLKTNKEYTKDVDCILIPNDSLYMGLANLFNRYASMLAENDATMRITTINGRMTSLISASDDATKKAAEQYLKDIEKGKLGVVAEKAFLESLKVQPYGDASHSLTQQIEFQQYLKASWLNDIGLNANYNMKREAVMSNEAQLNEDALMPFVDDMLRCRKEALEKVNAMFGTNITIDFAGTWKQKAELAEEDPTEVEPEQEAPEEEKPSEEKKDE